MSSFDTLEAMDEKSKAISTQKPFWQVNRDDEKELLAWLTVNFNHLYRASQPRFERYMRNIAAYQGQTYTKLSQTERERAMRGSPIRSKARSIKIAINDLHDMIEQNVSRETRFRPAVNVNPGTPDHDDKMASSVVEKVCERVWYREDVDDMLRTASRMTKVTSESYIEYEWQENKGPLHPDFLKKVFEREGVNPDKLSQQEKDEIVKNSLVKNPTVTFIDPETGNKIKIEKPLRIGEETFRVRPALYYILQPKIDEEDVEWAFRYEFVELETLQGKYPKLANKIRETRGMTKFDADMIEERAIYNECLVMHFWHKSTDMLDAGAHIIATPDCIIENEENKFGHIKATNGFPWVRRRDIEIPNQLYGSAAIEMGIPLQEWINKLTSLLIRQQALAAHPKWLAREKSVNVEAFGNDTTIMWYKGEVPPVLSQPNPGAQNTFNLIEILQKKLQQIMGVYGVSRGEPPAGVKAGVALQFLNEQEDERQNAQIAEHNAGIRDLAILTIAGAGFNYEESDGRLETLLGAQDGHLAKYFNFANLSREWDITVQAASALPQQKGARIQAILDLRREFPNRVDDDEVLDQIGFGDSDKFITINTGNIRAAEAENDLLLRAGACPEPEAWEDHLIHYRIHLRQLASIDMKNGNTPGKHVESFKEHIAMHEMLIYTIGLKNPAYLQGFTAQFPAFPIFFVPPMPIPALPPMQGQPAQGGQAPLPMDMGGPPSPATANPPQEVPQVENKLPQGAML